MLDILNTVDEWVGAAQPVALASVVSTWGSSPRQSGAKLAALADFRMVGSVSSGCVESAVLSEAIDLLKDGKPRLLNFGVSDEVAWDVGLACGGKISIYLEPLDVQWWRIASAHVQADQPYATATLITGPSVSGKVLMDESGVLLQSPGLSAGQAEGLTMLAREGLEQSASVQTSLGDSSVFVEIYQPRPRLVIVGGAHAAVALAQMASLLGYRVMLIDPRRAFATAERFPIAEVISYEYPDKALPKIGLTPQTYIAILTHDPKIDDPALKTALPSPVPYVGILSSKRTHEQRIERLTADGFDRALLDRIRTPIGLKIGAQTPEEIALCVLAEITAVRRGVLV
jgi:xanthine dehydrogenase accessory factor